MTEIVLDATSGREGERDRRGRGEGEGKGESEREKEREREGGRERKFEQCGTVNRVIGVVGDTN